MHTLADKKKGGVKTNEHAEKQHVARERGRATESAERESVQCVIWASWVIRALWLVMALSGIGEFGF